MGSVATARAGGRARDPAPALATCHRRSVFAIPVVTLDVLASEASPRSGLQWSESKPAVLPVSTP